MRRPPLFRTLLLLAACALCPPPAGARVFWRSGGGAWIDRVARQLNGATVYRAAVQVNGGRADVGVVRSGEPFAPTSARMRQALAPAGGFLIAGSRMAFGVAAPGGRIVRTLILAPGDEGSCAVFVIDQSRDDFEQAKAAPTGHMLPSVPEYPGARILSYIRNEDTRTAIQTATAPAAPAAALQFYESALARDGWSSPLGSRPAGERDWAFFLRGRDVCAVLVAPSDHPAECRITVLQKDSSLR